MNLLDAYFETYQRMKPQVQGTCGVYSFWFATILLHHMNPTKHPNVPFPRACHNAGGQLGPSMRQFAKTFGSAQGELLSAGEMIALVKQFGYTPHMYHRYRNLRHARKGFISSRLRAGHPVLFAYLCGDGPVTRATATGTVQDDFGPHWSLIIAETATEYIYIEPNSPNRTKPTGGLGINLEQRPKDRVLASNADADSVKFDRFWMKRYSHDLGRMASPEAIFEIEKVYDLGDPVKRQKLNEVLIAVS